MLDGSLSPPLNDDDVGHDEKPLRGVDPLDDDLGDGGGKDDRDNRPGGCSERINDILHLILAITTH